jgi:hypothetical protein
MNKLKSFKDIAQENAMHLLKKELAKEAKKAAINPSDAEEASEEKTMYCKDCGCEKGKPDPDCTCENDCNNLTAAQCTTEKSKCKSRKEDVNELTIADVQKGTAMAKKRQEKEREAGKKSVSTADLAARMPKKEAHNPKHVKQAVGIASDPRYKGGNMTGATKVINKLSKGLSDHPQVKAVLKRQNEGIKTFAEISKGMASRYIKKAQVSTADAAKSTERGYTDSRSPDRDIAKAGSNQAKKGIKTFVNRNKGTSTAVDKLTGKAKVPAKEGNVSEISNNKMGQYVRKAADDAARKASKGDVVGARQRVKGVSKAMDKIDKNRLFGRS